MFPNEQSHRSGDAVDLNGKDLSHIPLDISNSIAAFFVSFAILLPLQFAEDLRIAILGAPQL